MTMIRGMSDNTLNDRIGNECIREKFEVVQIGDQIREHRIET